MPFLPKAKRSSLKPTNEQSVLAWADVDLRTTPFFNLLRVMGAVLDEAIKGDNTYLTIGTTMDKTAISFTRRSGDEKDSVFAAGLDEVGPAVEEWLLPF